MRTLAVSVLVVSIAISALIVISANFGHEVEPTRLGLDEVSNKPTLMSVYSPGSGDALEDLIQQQRRQLAQLEQHRQLILQLQQQLHTLQQSNAANTEVEDELSLEAYRKIREEKAEIARETHSAILDERVSAESRDIAWAADFEDAIVSSVDIVLPDAMVSMVECLSTVCKIQLEYASSDGGSRFPLNKLSRGLPGFDEIHVTHEKILSDRMRSVVHIVRRGSGEVFNSEIQTRLGTSADIDMASTID